MIFWPKLIRRGIRGRKWGSYRVPITAEFGDYRLWSVILVLFDLPLSDVPI